MPFYETYASRVAAAESAGTPDVYIYDELPPFPREQIAQILRKCIGPGWEGNSRDYDTIPLNANEVWEEIADVMRREVESFFHFGRNEELCEYPYGHCMSYLRKSNDLAGVLSLIEISAHTMENLQSAPDWRGATEDPAEGVVELNQRFLRAGIGYQFENGQIVRVDSQYVHAEIVKEALRLLCEPGFEEANAEFMKAHRHLREGNLRDCNTAALRAVENVLKVICDARGWTYQKGDTVERLIAVVRANGLFPEYLGGYFDNCLEPGLLQLTGFAPQQYPWLSPLGSLGGRPASAQPAVHRYPKKSKSPCLHFSSMILPLQAVSGVYARRRRQFPLLNDLRLDRVADTLRRAPPEA